MPPPHLVYLAERKIVAFESLLLVKHWISSWNDRINFFAFPRARCNSKFRSSFLLLLLLLLLLDFLIPAELQPRAFLLLSRKRMGRGGWKYCPRILLEFHQARIRKLLTLCRLLSDQNLSCKKTNSSQLSKIDMCYASFRASLMSRDLEG